MNVIYYFIVNAGRVLDVTMNPNESLRAMSDFANLHDLLSGKRLYTNLWRFASKSKEAAQAYVDYSDWENLEVDSTPYYDDNGCQKWERKFIRV